MLNRNIDLKNGSFSFSDYFKLNIEAIELFNEFNYSLEKEELFIDIESYKDIKSIQNDLEILLDSIEFNSEIAIREFLISPILIFLLKKKRFRLVSEKSIFFDNRLKGVIDYYLENEFTLAVVEAKHQDLHNGFKQLGMELIALDNLIEDRNREIYGVVTIGTDWIFSKIDRDSRSIIKDKKIIRVPEELDRLVGILNFIIGIKRSFTCKRSN